MAIFLTILKVIGIVLLVLLSLIFFILIWVLALPTSYCVDFAKGMDTEPYPDGKMHLKATVALFLHIVSAKIDILEKNRTLKIYVFGIDITNLKSKFKKSDRDEEKDPVEKPESVDEAETAEEPELSENLESVEGTEPIDEAETAEESEPVEGAEADTVDETDSSPDSFSEEENTESKRKGLKLKSVFGKIKEVSLNIKKKLHNISDSFSHLQNKGDSFYYFIVADETGEGIRFVATILGKILKHIRPRVVKGNLRIGTGEPDTTGILFGAIGCAYGVGGKSIKAHIQPDFEEAVLEGRIYTKGYMVLGYLTYLALRVYFGQEFKDLRKEYDKFTKV